jgi:hypothetical protein
MEGKPLTIEVNGEVRQIGILYDKTLVIVRDREKHLMRKWNAYGINAKQIDDGSVDTVVLQEGKNQYLITAEDIKLHGRISTEGEFEKQYFVELDKFQKL